ncbi:MAG: thioredoxin family protein [bacterium]
MKTLKILGGGCAKCDELAERAGEAAGRLGIEYKIEKVTDPAEIAEYGVMLTPALVVDGEVKTAGDVPEVEKIKELLQ